MKPNEIDQLAAWYCRRLVRVDASIKAGGGVEDPVAVPKGSRWYKHLHGENQDEDRWVSNRHKRMLQLFLEDLGVNLDDGRKSRLDPVKVEARLVVMARELLNEF